MQCLFHCTINSRIPIPLVRVEWIDSSRSIWSASRESSRDSCSGEGEGGGDARQTAPLRAVAPPLPPHPAQMARRPICSLVTSLLFSPLAPYSRGPLITPWDYCALSRCRCRSVPVPVPVPAPCDRHDTLHDEMTATRPGQKGLRGHLAL